MTPIADEPKQKCGRCLQWKPKSDFAWEEKVLRRKKYLCKPCHRYTNKARINPDEAIKLDIQRRWDNDRSG